MFNDKKVLCIPPIFTITNLLQILVKKSISLILLLQNYVLPTSTNPITDQHLANIEFMRDDIKRIIRKLDPNKAHGHDMISISILEMLVTL